MASTNINHFKQWQLSTTPGIDGLKFVEDASIGDFGEGEVVVEMHAASLNFMDLFVAKGGYPGMIELPGKPVLITGADGAGIVKSVGSAVRSFALGDKVVTYLIPHVPDHAKINFGMVQASLGMGTNGTLTQYGKFHVSNVVHAPRDVNFAQAATLPCSGLTAYNALFGLGGREIALAVGAHVVATTSSAEKAARLRDLGVKDVINYHETPEWGLPARALTPDNVGFDHVLNVGGDATLGESVKAVRTDGIVSIIGLIGGPTDKQVPMMAASLNSCIVRGFVAGTLQQMTDFVSFVDEKGFKPALDDVEFGIDEVRAAYWRQERQQHFSKIVIKLQA